MRRQADAVDAARACGEAVGPLAGLPVGVKDIVDTADLPTENGTVLHVGRQPSADAFCVRALRAAGGVLMGKTVTTELATYAPGPTRNPHDPSRTPGGSSSGSAAAVAAGMVPLAIGTQTNGSVIRPASFCGVVGYKPGAGWLPRTGVLVQSPSFDALGVFARDLEGVALLAEVLAGHDPADPLSRPRATPPLLAAVAADPPETPRLGWLELPFEARLEPGTRAALDGLRARVAGASRTLVAPAGTWDLLDAHRLVMEAEIAGSFEPEFRRGRHLLSVSLQGQIERGLKTTAVDVRRALAAIAAAGARLDAVFDEVDALVLPAALGVAPTGLGSTGDPIACTLASACGLPALSLPLLAGAGGLPIGVQLVGRRDGDARLLRTARWLMRAAAAA